MKKAVLMLGGAVLVSASAWAGAKTYNCTILKQQDIIQDKTMTVELRAGESVTLKSKTLGKVTGDFDKKLKNGSSLYDCDSIVDSAGDQTDLGQVLVSADVEKGKTGTVTLSVRFTDDDGPQSFQHTDYKCTPEKN